jgi:hypothetical protein
LIFTHNNIDIWQSQTLFWLFLVQNDLFLDELQQKTAAGFQAGGCLIIFFSSSNVS